jgi:hypothetical protein
MKLVILYHPDSEFSTAVEDFTSECKKHTEMKVELLSLEKPDGSTMAETYGVVDYPSILVLRDDGQIVKGWQGSSLPPTSEVVGYLNG